MAASINGVVPALERVSTAPPFSKIHLTRGMLPRDAWAMRALVWCCDGVSERIGDKAALEVGSGRVSEWRTGGRAGVQADGWASEDRRA